MLNYIKKFYLVLPLFLTVFCMSEIVRASSNLKNQSPTSAFAYIEPQTIDKFVDELNRLGKLGYKLTATERYTQFNPPENYREIKIAGIAEHVSGDAFEYKWFSVLTLPQLIAKIDAPAKEGFYFSQLVNFGTSEKEELSADATEIEKSIETIKNNFSQDPEDGSLFILERKNNFRDPVEFGIATAKPDTSIFGTSVINIRNITKTLEESIGDIDTRSYQPVAAFFSSGIFKNRVSHLPTILFQNTWEHNTGAARPNYKIVEVFQFGNKFRKKMTDISSQGFEIAALGYNLAVVMETGRKVTNQWLKPSEKNFESDLNNIAGSGARFKLHGVDTNKQNILIFEQSPESDGKIRSYKTLKITDEARKIKGDTNLKITTSPAAIAEFELLQTQGYRAVSVFYKNGMNVLLEK